MIGILVFQFFILNERSENRSPRKQSQIIIFQFCLWQNYYAFLGTAADYSWTNYLQWKAINCQQGLGTNVIFSTDVISSFTFVDGSVKNEWTVGTIKKQFRMRNGLLRTSLRSMAPSSVTRWLNNFKVCVSVTRKISKCL